ncbi:MAG: hypothetical protein KDC90_18480 [Ignavibacteriae bacterium]|uniref:hypothetical protein n=1 Tax=Flavobacterium sp. TaxID=239 RepID=UPI001E1A6A12|nr:hypothetical protein [Ignavibacteriota bacterium]
MKTNLIVLLIAIFLLGCSTQKEKYTLMSEVFKNTREPYGFNDIDILEHTSIIYESFLEKGYKSHQKIYKEKGIYDSGGIFHWKDTINDWFLTDSDVEYMTSKLKTQKKEFWKSNNFKSNKDVKVNVIETPVLQQNKTLKDFEKEIYYGVNNGKPLYVFSAPIFNKKKDKAIISSHLVFLFGSGSIMFYKKINNKWELVGEYY